MSLVYNSNKFQYTVSQSLPFGEVRRGSSFNAYNSMKAYSFNGEHYGYYGYDASGERTYKYGLDRIDITTNQGDVYVTETYWEANEMMFYPNGYINMNQNGEYTKHYYADALRIASKIGSGFTGNICDSATTVDYFDYLNARITFVSDIMVDELNEVVVPAQDIQQINPMPYPTFCNLDSGGQEPNLFFYHPDHLGSTGMITDNNASVIQGLFYAPFGEIISDYNPSFHDTLMPNFAFNAKELDEENGMYYYSARYYAPPTFISRDPMFEKYPTISFYAYCANNPMKFVDPTGKDIVDENGNVIYTKESGWTKNASEDAKRIGNAMMETETGKKQFNKLVDSETKIQLKISSETKNTATDGVKFGSFSYNSSDVSKDKEGNYHIKAGVITIYEGSISSYLNGTGDNNINNDKSWDRASQVVGAMNATVNEYIAAVAGHEAEHATSQENINLHVTGKNAELVPNMIKTDILWDNMFNKFKK